MGGTRGNEQPSAPALRGAAGDGPRAQPPGRFARLWRNPLVAILLVAPFFGEVLSTATPPLDLLLPWNLGLMVALYGCGALICREVARQRGLGLLGLCLLAAAYGVYEEALVDRYWFNTDYWEVVGVGSYSEVWHTNLLLATHLTVFHTAVSICASILVVEQLFPARRERPWVGSRGLAAAAVALGVVVPFLTAEFPAPEPPVLVAAAALCLALVVAALLVPRPGGPGIPRSDVRRRRGLGVIAFTCTATHFVLVYTVPATGLPWVAGVALSLLPVAAGALLVRRLASTGPYGRDGLRVVTGILAFFVLLDFLVGLGGRYDLSVGAVATALALWWLARRDPPTGETNKTVTAPHAPPRTP